MFDLTGKVAIVTGGGGGLGRPISVALAQCGADVLVDDFDADHLAATVKEIEALGRKCVAVTADLTDAAAMKGMADKAVEEFGKIDILVNVAGTNARFDAEDMPAEEFERVLRVNVLGTFLACQAVGRVMIEQKHGVIVNMSSVRGRVAPGMGGSAYATSKGGVDQLTRTLAAEWAKYGIRVNAIAPALIMTDMTREFLSQPEVYAKMTAEIPMRRLGEPSELVGPAILLASDESSFMTGQIVYADGGLSPSDRRTAPIVSPRKGRHRGVRSAATSTRRKHDHEPHHHRLAHRPRRHQQADPGDAEHPGGDRAERQGGLRGRRRRHPHPPARQRRLHHRPRRGAAHRRPGARGVPRHRAALHRRRHGLRGPRADRRGEAGHGHAEPRHHDHRRPRVPQPAAD